MVNYDYILVSIIVPIYNVANYLERCVESIIDQKYKAIEIILVDDGSTDNSGRLCDSFAERDQRIQVIHQKNQGLVRARKAGLAKATGTYIGFVDGDDYVDEGMFENLLNNIEETEADFVHSGYFAGQEKEKCFDNAVIDLRDKAAKEKFLIEYVLDHSSGTVISPSIWSKLFKEKLIKDSYESIPDNQSIGEDWLALAECVMKSKRISLLNTADYHYTIREDSLSHGEGVEDLMWQCGLHTAMKRALKRQGYYEAGKRWLDNAFANQLCLSLSKKFEDRFVVTTYLFGDLPLVFGKRIVLYGAGAVGRSYYAQLCRYRQCSIVAWIDNNYQNIHYDYIKVVGKERLQLLDYEYVVIAVKDRQKADSIKKILINEGVEPEKLIWKAPIDACSLIGLRHRA